MVNYIRLIQNWSYYNRKIFCVFIVLNLWLLLVNNSINLDDNSQIDEDEQQLTKKNAFDELEWNINQQPSPKTSKFYRFLFQKTKF